MKLAESIARSSVVQVCLDRLRAGEARAGDDLLEVAGERLRRLTERMFRGESRVQRWEDADDVMQNATLRLHRALADVHPNSVRDFFRLAAVQIRRELIDVARRCYGPEGVGAHHESHGSGSADGAKLDPGSDTREPGALAMWAEFHERARGLPEEEQEAFDLLWYQGLSQIEAADVLGVSVRTLQRRWHAACDRLRNADGAPPI